MLNPPHCLFADYFTAAGNVITCWDKKYHSCLYLHDSSVPAAGDIKQLQDTKKIYQCSCWKSFNIDISYKARLVIGLFVSIDPAADVHGE